MINTSSPENLVQSIDHYAKTLHMTRSGFFSACGVGGNSKSELIF
jgi:hypothetical protein